jgi:hypothetical protein
VCKRRLLQSWTTPFPWSSGRVLLPDDRICPPPPFLAFCRLPFPGFSDGLGGRQIQLWATTRPRKFFHNFSRREIVSHLYSDSSDSVKMNAATNLRQIWHTVVEHSLVRSSLLRYLAFIWGIGSIVRFGSDCSCGGFAGTNSALDGSPARADLFTSH